MKCPNCLHEQPSDSTECMHCGIIFAKYKARPNRSITDKKHSISDSTYVIDRTTSPLLIISIVIICSIILAVMGIVLLFGNTSTSTKLWLGFWIAGISGCVAAMLITHKKSCVIIDKRNFTVSINKGNKSDVHQLGPFKKVYIRKEAKVFKAYLLGADGESYIYLTSQTNQALQEKLLPLVEFLGIPLDDGEAPGSLKLFNPREILYSSLVLFLFFYTVYGLFIDKIMMPTRRRGDFLEFYGASAWIIFFAVVCLAANLLADFAVHYFKIRSSDSYWLTRKYSRKIGWALFVIALIANVAQSAHDHVCVNHVIQEINSSDLSKVAIVFERSCGNKHIERDTYFDWHISVLNKNATLQDDPGNVLFMDHCQLRQLSWDGNKLIVEYYAPESKQNIKPNLRPQSPVPVQLIRYEH